MLGLKSAQRERRARDFPACVSRQALLQLRTRLPGFPATVHVVMIGGYLDSYGSCWRLLWMCFRPPRLLITCCSSRSNLSCNLLALHSMGFFFFPLGTVRQGPDRDQQSPCFDKYLCRKKMDTCIQIYLQTAKMAPRIFIFC